MRFSASQRIRRNRDFQAVRGRGRRLDAGAFVVWCAQREVLPGSYAGPRVGVAASRAIGNAVVRNLAKRRMRDLFRRRAELLPPAVDLVISTRKPVVELPFEELDQRFAGICRKIASCFSHA